MQNHYIPQKSIITDIKNFTPEAKLYTLELSDNQKLEFIPGQFVLISLLGFGEAPFGICSPPYKKDLAQICVRKVGRLTSTLDKLKVGDELGLRGPYGNGFDLKELENKDIIMAAGGTGIAPIVSLAEYLIAFRPKFGKIYLLYGARNPQELLFASEFKRWQKNVNLCLTVDRPDKAWKENTGLITTLCKTIKVNPKNSKSIMCGPPIMYKNMVERLDKLNISENDIYVSLERRMRCGIGKCQHCVCGKNYVCQDGPIFKYKDISNIPEEG